MAFLFNVAANFNAFFLLLMISFENWTKSWISYAEIRDVILMGNYFMGK